MKIAYKNNRFEKFVIAVNVFISFLVVASFVALLGFKEPLLQRRVLYAVQFIAGFCFVAEKLLRLFNARSKLEYLRAFWFEIPLFIMLVLGLVFADKFIGEYSPLAVRLIVLWAYLVLQVVDKVCRTVMNIAASSGNPMAVLVLSFLTLILVGSGLLMLPRCYVGEQIGFVDALFTSTSATCVTGLIVRDTGSGFTWAGQSIILILIQLGGLGIMVFGAVFALLLRQSFSVSETAALQDVLSSETAGRINRVIGFIFASTVIIEMIGAVAIHRMWGENPACSGQVQQHPVFASVFHSVSAFCNAGFSLCSDSLIAYRDSWQVYGGFVVLIILGGLGFGVLYNIANVLVDRVRRIFKKSRKDVFVGLPKKLTLQSKLVLISSFALIVVGMLLLYVFETVNGGGNFGLKDAFFQSVTARTAGFNSVDISAMSSVSKFVLMILMFIGGSPGSTAGGIKTVTLCVIIMAAVSAIRKKNELEIGRRSVRTSTVGRAITVVMFFVTVAIFSILTLSLTEASKGFGLGNIAFEAASALGTVGLSTGITSSLTIGGKVVIIADMLIGRLGPLTLLASLTFNLRPAGYNYPRETLIVG